jgi:hypothetical protein
LACNARLVLDPLIASVSQVRASGHIALQAGTVGTEFLQLESKDFAVETQTLESTSSEQVMTKLVSGIGTRYVCKRPLTHERFPLPSNTTLTKVVPGTF